MVNLEETNLNYEKIVKREKRDQLRLDTAHESRHDSRAVTTPRHFGHGTNHCSLGHGMRPKSRRVSHSTARHVFSTLTLDRSFHVARISVG